MPNYGDYYELDVWPQNAKCDSMIQYPINFFSKWVSSKAQSYLPFFFFACDGFTVKSMHLGPGLYT